jgi:hypothetical protein
MPVHVHDLGAMNLGRHRRPSVVIDDQYDIILRAIQESRGGHPAQAGETVGGQRGLKGWLIS